MDLVPNCNKKKKGKISDSKLQQVELKKTQLYLFLKTTYSLEVCCRLDFSNRLHESISDNDADICTRVSFCFLAKSHEIRLCETVGGRTQVEFEHEGSGMLLGQRDVNSLLKSEEVLILYSEHS